MERSKANNNLRETAELTLQLYETELDIQEGILDVSEKSFIEASKMVNSHGEIIAKLDAEIEALPMQDTDSASAIYCLVV